MSRIHIVVMGVSGSGKSTVGSQLASRLGLPFVEGDSFHSQASRDKMAAGIPLTDEDRWPWLERLRTWMDDEVTAGARGSVVACSALKRRYRGILAGASGTVVFIHPVVDRAVIAERMAHRPGHYMPLSLLDSQLATLEDLAPDECGVNVSATPPPQVVVDEVLAWLATAPCAGPLSIPS